MQRSVHLIAPLVCGAALLVASNAHAASDPTGVWFNDTGRGAIEIKPCGNALCGHVVWVKDQADLKGCGKQIIGEAEKVEGGIWDNGWIYSPEQKKRFDVELKVVDGKLRVMGYMGTKLFSKTMYWTKAPSDLARCDQVQAAVKPAPTTTAKVAEQRVPELKISDPKISEPKISEPKIAAIASKEADAPVTSTQSREVKPSAPDVAPAPTLPTAAPSAARQAPDVAQQAKINSVKTAAPETPSPEIETAHPAPASSKPAASTQVETEEPAKKSKQKIRLGNLDLDKLKLGDLKLDKIVKRSASGDCKIDLPFVKVRFKCED